MQTACRNVREIDPIKSESGKWTNRPRRQPFHVCAVYYQLVPRIYPFLWNLQEGVWGNFLDQQRYYENKIKKKKKDRQKTGVASNYQFYHVNLWYRCYINKQPAGCLWHAFLKTPIPNIHSGCSSHVYSHTLVFASIVVFTTRITELDISFAVWPPQSIPAPATTICHIGGGWSWSNGRGV